MADSIDKFIGTTLGERYEITDVIGEGGMAVVYKALDTRLNRWVAVKILREEMANDNEFKRRFAAESQAIALLNHPNIVSVFDVGANDICEYIVMELIDGITLKQYVERKGALNWREAVHFVKQIAAGLSHAHSKGIIHRDIKPQNIMLLRDGTIKVGDFGIASLENELNDNSESAIGSIHYMSPEQVRGDAVDARTDIYSMGVLLYEMLTGKLPFTGETPGEIAVKHLNATPRSIRELSPEVPETLEQITLQAMCSDLDKRLQDADAFLEAIDAFMRSVTGAVKGNAGEEAESEAPGVIPVRSVSELSSGAFKRRRKRARRVSFYSGAFASLVLCVALISFLWTYWFRDIFEPAERMIMPNLIRLPVDTITNDAELYSAYTFYITYEFSDDVPAGCVISQNPESGRSVMQTKDGIAVEITVSKGSAVATVPDVTGWDYRAAINELQLAGFMIEIENRTSDTIPADCVISTTPIAYTVTDTGAIVYIAVSTGETTDYYQVPNLVGLTENEAIAKIQNSNFTYGGCIREPSEFPAGTVFAQSVAAFEALEEHQKIVLTISSGNG